MRCEKNIKLDMTLKLAELLKQAYPAAKAPEAFAIKVMTKVKNEQLILRPLPILFRIGRSLSPFAAAAACAVLIIGLYFEGAFAPVPLLENKVEQISRIQRNDQAQIPKIQQNESEDVKEDNVPLLAEMPLINVDDYAEKADVPQLPLNIDPLKAEIDSLADDVPMQDVPMQHDNIIQDTGTQVHKPIQIQFIASPPDLTAKRGAEDKLPTDKQKQVTPIENDNSLSEDKQQPEIENISGDMKAVVLKEVDIPNSSVFIRRKRVIESLQVKLSIDRIDNALTKLDQIEKLFAVSADMAQNEIRHDGTIVMIKSYAIQSSIANDFVTRLLSLGTASHFKRNTLDITADYKNMIDLQAELVAAVASSEQRAGELNELVAQMMFLDKRSKCDYKNVVVWLEEGVDF